MASGGLDSTTVCYLLKHEGKSVYPLFFDYGQHCAELEWDRLNEVLPGGCEMPERVSLKGIFKGSSSRLISEANLWREEVQDQDLYVPFRTLLFFASGAARAQTLGISEVYSGFINSNHAKEIDCASAFMNGLEELAEGVGTVRFISPFRECSKADVVRKASDLGVPIGRTFSCQVAGAFPCGACPNCVERLEALREAEIR